jgi:serine/threonine-protein kinase
MPNISAEKFLECVKRSELVEEDRLTQVLAALKESDPSALDDAERLATKLIEAKLLTTWQCENLLQGKSSGFILGSYKLLRLLGSGGMSSVYLGEHKTLKVQRAIKVLPVSRVHDSSYLERFVQEAQAAARLNHPNIVQAYDIGVQKKHHYIVMEYVEGRDLQNLVKETGTLDYDLAANYIRQAAEGLAYAHQSGLIHRDIKPANLLVDPRGTVKLLDLGLARFTDEETPSLTIAHDENVLGTADYLAPEQAVDSHRVDSRADIYSLGCTLYYLLSGHPPFPTGTLPQRIQAHQNKSPASIFVDRNDAPQALVDVCSRMMAKSPEARFQTAKEVADVLTIWLTGRTQGGTGDSSGGGARPQNRARPLPPPRRGTTATLAPPTQPNKTNDTISDMERETIKGPPARRPAVAPGSDTRAGGPLSSAKLGKEGRRPGDSGRTGNRPANLPMAQSIEPPLEDLEDLTNVLMGPSNFAPEKDLSRSLPLKRRKPEPEVSLPKWVWFVIPPVLLLAILVIVLVWRFL